MLRQRSDEIDRQQRRQRRALVTFLVAATLLLGFCVVAGLRILVPPPTLIPVGRVEDYTDHQPRRYDVPKLQLSSMITRRDQSISEDVVYVRREGSDGWVALLGVDTLSGCFLYWDAESGLYKDINCLGSRYTPDGRYLDGLVSGETPQNMVRLPVEVHEGQVSVRDEIARGP
jgi:Rieske Fe-S protein